MKDDNRPHLSTLPLYFSVQLANACLIALSPRALGRVVGNVALLGIIIFGLRLTTGQVELNYLVGCMFAEQTFSMFLFTWLTDPIHDFRHECDHVAPKELPFVRRVWWALCLLNSPRGIGWSYKVGVVTFTFRLRPIHQATLDTKPTAASERGAVAVRPEGATKRIPVVPPHRRRQGLRTQKPTVLEARHGPVAARLPHTSRQH